MEIGIDQVELQLKRMRPLQIGLMSFGFATLPSTHHQLEGELFNLHFLHRLREQELEEVVHDFPSGARVLDFGAGTGLQSAILRSMGFDVVAVDLANSSYSNGRTSDVIEYDGGSIPLPDHSVDVVFSSNVLEHVEDLTAVLSEFARVLRPGGIEIHVMPTPAWRFWTFVTGIPTAAIAGSKLVKDLFRRLPTRTRISALVGNLKIVAGAILPIGHGTSREGLSELWTFSVHAWKARFKRSGHELVEDRPLGLFYTGHMLLGDRLSFANRRRLGRKLGSATHLYLLVPARIESQGK